MSEFSVNCPHCAQTQKTAVERVGSVITCSKCEREFPVKAVRPQVMRLGDSASPSGATPPPPAPSPASAKQSTGKNTKVFKVVKRAASDEAGAPPSPVVADPGAARAEARRPAEGGTRMVKVLDLLCKAGLVAVALYCLVRADFAGYGRGATVEQQQVCGIQQLVLLAKSFLFFFLAYVVRLEALVSKSRVE